MVPAEPCVFETSRSYRNDVRVEIAATIRNRLIVAIQPELRVALGRWRACGSFRWSTAGRWWSCLTGVYGGAVAGGSRGPLVYKVVRASSASIHHLPGCPPGGGLSCPGLQCRILELVRCGGHQRPGTVADRHRSGQPLRGADADRVRCDVGGQVRVGRIGQVVAERDPDAVARRRGPDHHDAGLGHEADQVRHDREQCRGRAGPDNDAGLRSRGGLRGLGGLDGLGGMDGLRGNATRSPSDNVDVTQITMHFHSRRIAS
jgi:hypothetical protein